MRHQQSRSGTMCSGRKRTRTEDSSNEDSCSDASGGPDVTRIKISERAEPNFPIQVDWRRLLCQNLDLDHQESDDVIRKSLQGIMERLREADRLLHSSSNVDQLMVPEYQIMHRVRCLEQATTELFLGEPWPVTNTKANVHLRGSGVVDNLELHLERHKEMVFIVYRDYTCCRNDGYDTTQQPPSTIRDDALESLRVNESVSIVANTLILALEELWSVGVNSSLHPKFAPFTEFNYPYVWWYCQRDQLRTRFDGLATEHLPYVLLFQTYLDESLGNEYQIVDQLLEDGQVMTRYLPYLYVPGEIQLSKLDGDDARFHRAFKATSWLQNFNMERAVRDIGGNSSPELHLGITGISWSYDGSFQKNKELWSFKCKLGSDEIFDIKDLDIIPLRFANPEAAQTLRHRGERFWECRRPNYISYRNESNVDTQDVRHMVDYNTYKEMHSPLADQAPNRDDLGVKATEANAPLPSDDVLLCLPPVIPGYHMHKKEWFELYVSRIRPVRWNDNAFTRLVVPENKKQLIKALVIKQIMAEESTDLISGKGNGLFILLHGGPGTGKTLTAESVAEIARKPLYRVTCGDVGTKAEEVERYLETVLLLGKRWGCVVLLDEADVFLMQRSVKDFKRNALVSVFLRVLEYYDGILILTSNRVGTFDAAFKSRIQLSLHYPPLTEKDRLQIWSTFVEHVEGLTNSQTVSLGIRSRDIRDRLPELSKKMLNGREIRNAISTARQLAMFEQEAMGYQHLETVVSEMEKFDEYATELKGGLTDDVVARHYQER